MTLARPIPLASPTVALLNAALAMPVGTVDVYIRRVDLPEVMAWAQENGLQVVEQQVNPGLRVCRVYRGDDGIWPVVVIELHHAAESEAA